MSPLSSLETIFDCKACGTLLFAGTSILSTEISLPDVSTVFAKKTATPTSAQPRESLLNPHSDFRGSSRPMEIETSGLDNQSDCSSVDTTLLQGITSPTAPLVNIAQRWETVDFEGQRMRPNHCNSNFRNTKSFHFSPSKFQDADSVQSSRNSINSATSGTMDWERTSTTPINSPLKLEYGVMSDQPPVGIPYLKLMVGMTVGNSPTHTHPSTPNNPIRAHGTRSFCYDSPDFSEVSSSAVSVISQSRPQSAEKRRWLARMAMEGHGASATSPRKVRLSIS